MNWTELYHVEEQILTRSTQSIRKFLHADNAMVKNLYFSASHKDSQRKKSIRTPVDVVLSQATVVDDDYYYLSGGHWIPANCHPRWKVQFPQVCRLNFIYKKSNNINFVHMIVIRVGRPRLVHRPFLFAARVYFCLHCSGVLHCTNFCLEIEITLQRFLKYHPMGILIT